MDLEHLCCFNVDDGFEELEGFQYIWKLLFMSFGEIYDNFLNIWVIFEILFFEQENKFGSNNFFTLIFYHVLRAYQTTFKNCHSMSFKYYDLEFH